MAVVFSNNAKTTLASNVSTSTTSIAVVDGSVFPALSGSDYTYVTFEDGSGNVEIVKVTARSGNTLTVVRAQDNTSARAFSAGDKCELRLTAAGLNEVASQADTDTNTTYSVGDGGLTQNNFTNADHTKLNGIASGATNVTNNNQLTNGAGYVTTDTNTTYTVGDGGLTQNNFTNADHTKLNGIAANANNYTLPFTNNSTNWNTAYTYSQVGHLPLAGGTLTGFLKITDALAANSPLLDLHNSTNGGNVDIRFTDIGAGTSQFGNIIYNHQDSKSYGSGAHFEIGSSEATTTILADGKLMYKEGIYSKPANGTGAGTRKDANWDTAYGWGNHATAGYYAANNDGSGSGLDADKLDGVQGSSFLRSDATDTASGAVTFSAATIYMAGNLAHHGDTNTYMGFHAADQWRVVTGGTERLEVNNSAVTVAGTLNANYLRADRLYSNNDGSSGYFFNDSGTRTAYTGGDFYIQSAVGTYYNYATNQYLGSTSGDTIRLRGNQMIHNGWTAQADGHIKMNDNKHIRFGTGGDVEFFCSGAHMYTDLNSGIGNWYIRDGSTNRFTFDDAGHFTATGNVTAYSDIRLKEDIKPIEDAVSKVQKLSGNTYTRNDLKDPDRRYGGVIAQEVEAVLPEAVSDSEDGTKTVDYNALIGLLVQSIKELKSEVDDLKAQMENK